MSCDNSFVEDRRLVSNKIGWILALQIINCDSLGKLIIFEPSSHDK